MPMTPAEDVQESIDYYTNEVSTLLSTITDVKTYRILDRITESLTKAMKEGADDTDKS